MVCPDLIIFSQIPLASEGPVWELASLTRLFLPSWTSTDAPFQTWVRLLRQDTSYGAGHPLAEPLATIGGNATAKEMWDMQSLWG